MPLDASPVTAPREVDAALLARAQGRDEAACRAFVRCYEARVFALLSRLLPGRGAAVVEDLAQDTFARAFAALPRFDARGPARPSTWLLTIATRVALDEAKRARRAPTDPLDDVDPPSPAASSEEHAARAALERRVRRAVVAMPEEYRAAFVLRVFHELSHDEIARALDVEEGTVKSRIARARAFVRDALAEVRA